MSNHLDLWMDAYLDGELPEPQLAGMETHLSECEPCRRMLEQRRAISALLQEASPAIGLSTERRFTDELRLRLPRRKPSASGLTKWGLLIWQAIPVVLLMAWIFIQTVSILGLVLGLVPGIEKLSIFPADPPSALSGLSLPAAFLADGAGFLNPLNWNVFMQTAVLFVIGALYAGWLAGWWLRDPTARKNIG